MLLRSLVLVHFPSICEFTLFECRDKVGSLYSCAVYSREGRSYSSPEKLLGDHQVEIVFHWICYKLGDDVSGCPAERTEKRRME